MEMVFYTITIKGLKTIKAMATFTGDTPNSCYRPHR